MGRIGLNELDAFVAVAELGVRLFNRTTRSVALTAAGSRLLAEIQPILEGLDHALESVNSFRDKPMGLLRLAVTRPFATLLLAPLVQPFLAEYPEIRLEIVVDDSRSDIVSGRFDAGIRVGHQVERDMTILRIADEFRMLAVATPGYLADHPKPAAPKDLHAHRCIQFRLPWDGTLLPWIFVNGEQHTEIAVEGSLIVNDVDLWLSTILDGVGVGYLPEPIVAGHLAHGRLVNLFEDWSGERTGVFLYHPSRRQTPAPLQVFLKFIEAWRRRDAPW
jgi:DNA-binding transcriptional LysR family regulator